MLNGDATSGSMAAVPTLCVNANVPFLHMVVLMIVIVPRMSSGSVSGLHLHLEGVPCVVPKRNPSDSETTPGIGQIPSLVPGSSLLSQPAQALIVTCCPAIFGSSSHWIANSPS